MHVGAAAEVRVHVGGLEPDLAQRLGLREGDQLGELDQLSTAELEVRADRVADGFGDRSIWPSTSPGETCSRRARRKSCWRATRTKSESVWR